MNKVIFGAMDGKLYLVSRKNGQEITSYEIGEPISSTPAIVGQNIIVGCEDGNVYAFESKGNK